MSNYIPEPLMGKRGDDSVFYRVAVGNDARHAKVRDTPRTDHDHEVGSSEAEQSARLSCRSVITLLR